MSTLKLSTYVKRRTGVNLGHSHSLKNMFVRSFGANSFALFWHYWNPIWSYYLAKYIQKPCSRIMPHSFALIITFTISGALHDLAVSLVKLTPIFFFTPWFLLMAILVIAVNLLKVNYANLTWGGRAFINASFIVSSFLITIFIEQKLLNYFDTLS
ncbi:acyltransferase [Thalassotalea sp. 1_MG-2023]|uniref:acyltransferase n=1 Tax=Thalassotalea sp. 1_MG-2023 TaxID=3062680 RepID=UPI0034A2D1A9